MSIIPKPKFPNIPALPGVPQLLRSPIFPASAVPVLLGGLAIGKLFQALFTSPTWGVFDTKGTIVIKPDSVVDFGYRNNYSISTFPVQRGAFAAYNKVANPFEASVRMTKGGTLKDREDFIADIEGTIADTQSDQQSLTLYTVLTPERQYENVSLERYESFRRSGAGAYFIDVDLYFREIRQVRPQYTSTAASTQNAQNPSALPPENQLRVQPAVALATFASVRNLRPTP